MRKPPDEKLQGLIEGIVRSTVIGLHGLGQMLFIDKEYRVRATTYGLDDLSVARANRNRQLLLQSGELLAVVMTGQTLTDVGQVVCQYFPTPGQVEVYALTYPMPQVSWADQDDPDIQEAITEYQSFWNIDALR